MVIIHAVMLLCYFVKVVVTVAVVTVIEVVVTAEVTMEEEVVEETCQYGPSFLLWFFWSVCCFASVSA